MHMSTRSNKMHSVLTACWKSIASTAKISDKAIDNTAVSRDTDVCKISNPCSVSEGMELTCLVIVRENQVEDLSGTFLDVCLHLPLFRFPEDVILCEALLEMVYRRWKILPDDRARSAEVTRMLSILFSQVLCWTRQCYKSNDASEDGATSRTVTVVQGALASTRFPLRNVSWNVCNALRIGLA